MNSSDSFESDEEREDIRRIEAAIAEIEHTDVDSTSPYDTAILYNRACDEKLQQLQLSLQARLQECRARLAGLRAASESGKKKVDTGSTGNFRYVNCGKPYFKDKQGFAAPDNEDTKLMRKCGMYDFSSVCLNPGWTKKDQSQFLELITALSKELKIKNINSQIRDLEREQNFLKKTKKQKRRELRTSSFLGSQLKKIAELKKKITDVDKEPLMQLALPLDQEYDWDYIADELNNRHTAEEYRSFWKMFMHPSINKKQWTKAEHKKLHKIALENNMQDWDAIAQQLGTGRTSYQCFSYFRANMNIFTSRKWTREEEEYLLRLVEFHREKNYIPWGKVAASMENRTKAQIYKKYSQLCELRKGKFLPEEDAVILTCANLFGENFKKMTEYVQGRSVNQCRTRFRALTKTKKAVTWTVDEDRKLMQLLANQDPPSYSSASKNLAGKNRVQIRNRFLLLSKWMKKNPDMDISHAPRGGAKTSDYGNTVEDLMSAISNLKKRLEDELAEKKAAKITIHSSEELIDDAIIALVADKDEEEEDDSPQELQASQEEPDRYANFKETNNVTVLRSLLILLQAKLDKEKFKNSPLYKKYPGLLEPDAGPSTLNIKTYSKKVPVKKFNINNNINIWGNALPGPLSYVLPPNYDTITGYKKLISTYGTQRSPDNELDSVTTIMKRNMMVEEEVHLLVERFKSLFLWPLILGKISPEDCKLNNNKE